jgi:hypothetical protein
MDLKSRPQRPLPEREENHSVSATSPSSDEKCPVPCQSADETAPPKTSVPVTHDSTEICRSPKAPEESDGEGSDSAIEQEPVVPKGERQGPQNRPSGDEIPSVPCQVTAESEQPGTSLPASQEQPKICRAPRPLARPVSLKGRMVPGQGYQPENSEWFDELTEPGKGIRRHRRVGRHPMSIPPAVLAAAGHPPRRTRALVKDLGDEPINHEIRRHSDLSKHCRDCSADSKQEVRYCPIIDCPFWPHRMGRNPHNPRRGRNPFPKKRTRTKP